MPALDVGRTERPVAQLQPGKLRPSELGLGVDQIQQRLGERRVHPGQRGHDNASGLVQQLLRVRVARVDDRLGVDDESGEPLTVLAPAHSLEIGTGNPPSAHRVAARTVLPEKLRRILREGIRCARQQQHERAEEGGKEGADHGCDSGEASCRWLVASAASVVCSRNST